MRINKNKVKNIFFSIISVFLFVTAIFCTVSRIAASGISIEFDALAAGTTMPAGTVLYEEESSSVQAESQDETSKAEESKIESTPENLQSSQSQKEENLILSGDFQSSEISEGELKEYEKQHEGEEKYPVLEFNTTSGNQSYGEIQMKNASSINPDIKSELESELGFKISNTKEPQVLIYHTHTCESFLTYDTGYFFEGYYPRTTDLKKNVCAVGDEIARQLNNAGIVTLHDKTIHDDPSYNGAYDRSYDTVMSYLEKYPSIKVVLDIHRDGIGNETQISKPVFEYNGKKAAQVMILAGYNYDDDPTFGDWEYNLRFALQIQKKAQNMFPDMMRPLYFADFMYNMNINTGSLLIEIGANGNTLEEVRYSGCLLGKALAEVLKEQQ